MEDRHADTRAKELLTDLYDYFRMDSSMDPIILFEHLCCVLIQLPNELITFTHDESDSGVVERYKRLTSQFDYLLFSGKINIDLSVFLNRPELIRRLLDTADKIRELVETDRQLVPILTDFLETILQSKQNDTLRTPYQTAREIAKLVLQTDQTMLNQKVLDPACGGGSFLLAALELLGAENVFWPALVKGMERDEHLRNCVLLLAHFYNRLGVTIEVTDGGFPVQVEAGAFDFVLSNLPFRPQPLRDRELMGDNGELPVPTKDAYRALIQRALLGLKPGGAGAIIVPDSFLAHTSQDAIRVRRWIVEQFRCLGVVKLPSYTFYPQASVNASVLLVRRLERFELPSNEEIFFFMVETDGRSNDTRRLPISRNDFDELREVWDKRNELWWEWREAAHTENAHGMAVPVQWDHPHFWFGDMEDVRRRDYSLLPEQYHPNRFLGGPAQDPAEILDEMRELGEEIMELMRQMAEVEYDG